MNAACRQLWNTVRNYAAILTIKRPYGLAPGNCRIACTWGDSVLEDSEKEFSRRMQLVSSGLLKDELMLGWYFGEPCETPVEQQAIREKYMPEMEKLLRDTE